MPQQSGRKARRRGRPTGRRVVPSRRRTRYGLIVLLAVVGILLFALTTAVSISPVTTPSPSAVIGNAAVLPA